MGEVKIHEKKHAFALGRNQIGRGDDPRLHTGSRRRFVGRFNHTMSHMISMLGPHCKIRKFHLFYNPLIPYV